MFIQFEPKGLQLLVICGPGEKYEPTKELLDLHEKLIIARSKLKEKEQEVEAFNNDYLEPIVKDVQEAIKGINSKLNPQLSEKKE